MKGLHIFDCEASGLLTEPNLYYHCVLFKEYAKPVFNLFLPPEHDGYEEAITWVRTHHNDVNVNIHTIDKLEEWLTTAPAAIACHNMFGYDCQLMEKLSGIHFDMFRDPKCMGSINDKQVNLYDTLSMSRTLWPDRPLPKGCPESVKNPVTGRLELVAPHGLMAWGYRVANKKVKIDDWRNQPLWEYVHRVWEDVIINELVWKELMDEMQCKGKFEDTAKFLYKDTPYGKQHKINWKNALRRGMLADYLMLLQERQGVWFDTEAAEKLCARIDTMMKEIEDEVEPLLPPKPMSESQRPKFPSRPFNRDGSISSTGYKWLEKLGYPVDFSAFDYVAPPAKPFTSTGGLSAAGARWCLNEFGIEDPEKAREFLSEYAQKPAPQPLPNDLLEKAKKDLHDQKEPDFLVPMKLSNQDDIKRYLVNTAGWKPTMWRTKDVTKDSFKKERKDDVIHTYVESYLDDLDQSEYKYLILEYLRSTNEDFQITNRVYDGRKENETREKKVFAAFRRLARALPTSPMLKDTFGHLCPNLEKIDADTAKKIVKWLSLRNRRGVLRPMNEKEGESKGWLNHPRLAIDHKLPAGSSGITNTGRRKHCVVCNVPKPSEKVLLGKEMRGLLGVDTTKYYEVGIDGSNLEQLIGAWGAYEFDDGLYYHTVSQGDAHAVNAKAYSAAAGKEVSRGDGKPITYGVLYGAQAPKVASMLDVSREIGQKVIDALWDANPGLKGRKEALEEFWEATGRKFIYGLDGRKLYARSRHSLLNLFQQNGGALLCDLVGILMHYQLIKRGWYDLGVRRIIYYHDEYQLQVPLNFRKTYYFSTIEELEAFKAEQEAKGTIFDGHKYKKERRDENGEKMVDKDGNQLYDPILNENGKLTLMYCPIGEMVVKCFWQASKMLGVPFQITGEYLTGRSWGECH